MLAYFGGLFNTHFKAQQDAKLIRGRLLRSREEFNMQIKRISLQEV